jgi:hypothetical protein
MRAAVLISGFIWLAGLTSSHAGQKFSSGPARVALLELFSSEGCSSCPPMEKWLGSLRDDPQLWRNVVPVAWHVNYWDRLGWKDPYAANAYTNRQYAYAKSWQSGSVYTPCLVRNGQEWRRGSSTGQSNSDGGALILSYQTDKSCHIIYTPPVGATGSDLVVTVALLGHGITSRVRAGENSGRNLQHEFIVLSTADSPMKPDGNGNLATTLTLPSSTAPAPPRYSIAAWVTRQGALEPVQATGGWLH